MKFYSKLNSGLYGWILLVIILTLSFILSIVAIAKNNSSSYDNENIVSNSIQNKNTITTDILNASTLSASNKIIASTFDTYSSNSNFKMNGSLEVDDILLQKSIGKLVNTQFFFQGYNAFTLTNTTSNPQSTTTMTSINYTPVLQNSIITLQVEFAYSIGGDGGNLGEDAFISYIQTGNDIIGKQYQRFANGSGGGTRSGTLFPLFGRYVNTDTTELTFSILILNQSSDNEVTILDSNHTYYPTIIIHEYSNYQQSE